MIERPVKQQEKSERSTNAMLDAAAALIVEGGFASVTFAAIGERAGYSRGLVTSRFGSKDGLVEELIDRIVKRWSHRNVLPRTTGKPGLEGLCTMLDAISRQAAAEPSGLRVLYALMFEALGQDEVLRTRFAEFHATMRTDFARIIARGRKDGSIRTTVDSAAEAILIIGGLRGIGYQWLLDPDRFDIVAALDHLRSSTEQRLAVHDTAG